MNTVASGHFDTVVQAREINGGVHMHPPAADRHVPGHLPPRPRTFAGRDRETRQLTAAVARSGIAMICGGGGIGKTWLALHWAYQNIAQFPDGQLFADLRGFDAAGEPKTPCVVLHFFLQALGVESGRIPVDIDGMACLYRSLVAGKRMFILLDNVRDIAQVTPLLPGSSSCVVVITGRSRLVGLFVQHDAQLVPMGVLSAREAHALLTRRLGFERIAGEPAAVGELLDSCAGLPLALGVVAGRATARPGFTLTRLAEELRDTATRLGVLDEHDPATSLSAVFSWSYAALTDREAETFLLMCLAPGQDLSLPAVASLVGLPVEDACVVLRELERVSLVQEPAPERFRVHDLIRLYGIQQARQTPTRHGPEVALRRLVDFYLHTSRAADRLLDPDSQPVDIVPATEGCRPAVLETRRAALAWFEAEHSQLLAVQELAHRSGWRQHVWQLAWTLHAYHLSRGHLHHDLAIWRLGYEAVEGVAESAAKAIVHQMLGYAYSRLGVHAQALRFVADAIHFAVETGNLAYRAAAHHAAAQVWGRHGDTVEALRHAAAALRIYRAVRTPLREAFALNMVGNFAARLGDFELARGTYEAALSLFRAHHHRLGEATILDSLGRLADAVGHTEALGHYQHALVLLQELGDTYAAAETLERLGQTYRALDQNNRARAAWRQAMRLYRTQRRTADADRLECQLQLLKAGVATVDGGPWN
ncbi:ATP-binding protein [Kutzneria sp. CA-103260]|uniref:ATP-binding protein n=1 Tax=Kutzneria sp. CA-103260 TaxID=2802641 RepID=UPI001BAD2DBC|nr:tetratricopeptide repeat protein [Kutzneria sp. CA-103260]